MLQEMAMTNIEGVLTAICHGAIATNCRGRHRKINGVRHIKTVRPSVLNCSFLDTNSAFFKVVMHPIQIGGWPRLTWEGEDQPRSWPGGPKLIR